LKDHLTMLADGTVVEKVNEDQLQEMRRAISSLDPKAESSAEKLHRHLKGLEAMVVYNYQIAAYNAVRLNAEKAAREWESYLHLCNAALRALGEAKAKFADATTPEVYDLTLDYKSAATERRDFNRNIIECQKLEIPAGLFPNPN
jgi:hypothetical protein